MPTALTIILPKVEGQRSKVKGVWSVNFQLDLAITDKPVNILSMADEHSGECFGGIVDHSFTGRELGRATRFIGHGPRCSEALRMDSGSELISSPLADWVS